MSNRLVSIIIVTRGIKDYLKSCLDSLNKQSYPQLEIIVIDNSLNTDFIREIIKQYLKVELYSSSRNLPYCESLNKGIQLTKGNFILCLNDDATLDGEFIERALRGFNINEKIGMVSGKVLRQDGITIDSAGLFLSLWRTAEERGYGTKDRGQFEKEEYIFGVNGAVAFYRREMLEAIKLGSEYFDSDYHFFYEDLDIAWRANRFGWKGYYIPDAVAYHVRGGTARPDSGINKPYARRYLSTDLQLDLIKNRYLTMIKNEFVLSFLMHLPFILLYDILAWIYVLFFKPSLIVKFILSLKYLDSAFNKRAIIRRMEDETTS